MSELALKARSNRESALRHLYARCDLLNVAPLTRRTRRVASAVFRSSRSKVELRLAA